VVVTAAPKESKIGKPRRHRLGDRAGMRAAMRKG
jgi:hypothetical protein